MRVLSSLLLVLLAAAVLAPGAQALMQQAMTKADEGDGYAILTPFLNLEVMKEGAIVFERVPGGDLGDDTYHIGQTISEVSASADPALDPDLAAALEGSLRETRIDHPTYALLREVDERLVERLGAPVDLFLGDQGMDVGFQLPSGEERIAGEKQLAYPGQTYWYGVPVNSDDESVSVVPSYVDSTDRQFDTLGNGVRPLCGEMPEGRSAPPCLTDLALAAVDEALPNVVLHSELQNLTVQVNPPLGLGVLGATHPAGSFMSSVVGVAGQPLSAGEGADDAAPQEAMLPFDDTAFASHASSAPEGAAASAQTIGPVQTSDGLLSILAAAAAFTLIALAVPLYRRIVRQQVAEHDVRSRIVAFVTQNPGLHESAVAKGLGISHTLAQYHVRMLAEFGLLEVKRFGGRKCLFTAGQVGRTEKTMMLAEKGRGAQVVDIIAAQPGIAQRELARALGIRESSVKWHLDRMEQNGVVVVERSLEGKRIRLSAEAEQGRLATFTRAGPDAVAARASDPRPEPQGPPAPLDPRAPSPLHAAEA